MFKNMDTDQSLHSLHAGIHKDSDKFVNRFQWIVIDSK